MIDTYINKIASTTKRGDAREESYYPALAELLANFSDTKRHKKVHVTVLPKKTEAGNPDFRVWDGKHSQVGYVEAKSRKYHKPLKIMLFSSIRFGGFAPLRESKSDFRHRQYLTKSE